MGQDSWGGMGREKDARFRCLRFCIAERRQGIFLLRLISLLFVRGGSDRMMGNGWRWAYQSFPPSKREVVRKGPNIVGDR